MSYIEGNGYKFKADYSVLDKTELDDLVLVIYDYMELPKNDAHNNLFAYDKNGVRVWIAESPGENLSAYYSFSSTDPLVANSFCSHTCTINKKNGKLIKKVFYK
jgi:type IV secretory pathway ATPase VirB11/archaellum biosynthesis ATPase